MPCFHRLLIGLLVWATALAPFPVFAEEQGARGQDAGAKQAIGEFLGRLFDVIAGPGGDKTADGAKQKAIKRDPLDERAVVNREQQTQFEQARRLLHDGEHRLGLRLLQHVQSADEDSLLLSEEGEWRSLHAIVDETLLSAPPDVLQEYLELYALPAENELAQIGTSGDVRALASITRRYLATPAGQIAADRIASEMFDAGHIAEAAYWYQRLLEARAPIAEDDAWRGKATRAFRLLGRTEAIKSLEMTQDETSPLPPARRLGEPSARRDVRSDWTQPFGGPTHRGTTPAGRPVLIPRWSQPLTQRPHIAAQVRQLIADLDESGRTGIPAAMPLGVDGKAAYRTFRGVSVVDLESGRLLWESPEGVSVERLLSGEPVTRPATEIGTARIRPMPDYESNGSDQHHLANLLFRDGVYGLLSSDGERVFVLEDHATLSYRRPGYFRGQPQNDDPYGRDWASNRLVAYDLDTGRRLWSVGGPRQADPSPSLLAETLFHGPPVVDGDELFLIGEHRGAEHLYVLDRHTGRLLWSHMLSGVSAEIEYDLVRRWWPAQAAVGPGVIICPTTVGWMVAIDRHERRIRWAHRLITRDEGRPRSHQATVSRSTALNTRWSPSAPVLAGDRVVVTPSELPDPERHTTPQVICLDALTGQVCWDREKRSGLYLGGVFGRLVLLVGSDQVEARDLADGHLLWKTPLPHESGPPCGRGIVTGTDYLLPLQSGEVWRLALSDGAVTDKSPLRDSPRLLGNLLVYRDRLLALSPLAVTCFENRDAVESLLVDADRAAIDPRDKLRAAELQLIDGHHAAAVTLLRGIDVSELDHNDAERALTLRREALTAVAKSDLASAADELAELEELADGVGHLTAVRDLQAARAVALGEHREAFEIYWDLAQRSSPELINEGETSIRRNRWLASRLGKVWRAMNPDQRAEVDAQIEATVTLALEGPTASCTWWSEILSFHPQRQRLDEQLVERALAADRLAEAEIRLLRLLDSATSVTSQRAAFEQLVKLLNRQSRQEDAAVYIAQRHAMTDDDSSQTPAAELPTSKDGPPAIRFDSGSREPLGLGSAAGDGAGTSAFVRHHDWASEEFSLSRTSTSFNQQTATQSLRIVDSLPAMDHFQFQILSRLGRLRIATLTGERVWETPLKAQGRSRYRQPISGGVLGQLLLFVQEGVLHALSVPDRELLWHRASDVRTETSAYAADASQARPPAMTIAATFRLTNGLKRQSAAIGLLAVWRPGYVCYRSRNALTAADPLTGQTQWTRRGIGPETLVHGNARHVIVIPSGPDPAFALSAHDGAPVELPQLDRTLASAIGIYDEGLVTMEDSISALLGFRGSQTRLKLVDPQTGETDWETSFPAQTLFSRIAADEILALEPEGTVRVVNWTMRQDRTLGRLDADEVREARSIHAVADRTQIYLCMSRAFEAGYWSDAFPSVPVHGTLAALDRAGGGLVWQESVKNQNLLLEPLDSAPVLVLHSRRARASSPAVKAQQIHLQMLDKWTGKELLGTVRYVSPSRFRSVDVDLPARIIDLQTYNERLRIQPADSERGI